MIWAPPNTRLKWFLAWRTMVRTRVSYSVGVTDSPPRLGDAYAAAYSSTAPGTVQGSQLPPPPAPESPTPARSKRITGIDMARGIAMFSMTVVHFVAFFENEGETLATIASVNRGRAMPLFVMLGGIGVTFLTRRAATPERDLIIRAVMLFALGLFLTEYVDRIAIILQSYGLFFVIAAVLWRLPSSVLLALVPTIIVTAMFTYQLFGEPRVLTPFDEAFTVEGIESLVIDGFYPLFPVGALFVFGIWLGRIDLSSERVAMTLAGVGTVVGAGVHFGANALVSAFNLQIDFGGRRGDGMFHLTRLLDTEGHSEMTAWVLSVMGSSSAVLGFSLLIAPRIPKLVHPISTVGSMALTYYVWQAWLTTQVAPTIDTTIQNEWILVFIVYFVFVGLALIYRIWFTTGPLEWVLRLGSGPKKPRTEVA